MAKYRISHDAQADIVDILRFTHNRFGDAARRRYQALIGAALEAVATAPQQVGSISREELGAWPAQHPPRLLPLDAQRR